MTLNDKEDAARGRGHVETWGKFYLCPQSSEGDLYADKPPQEVVERHALGQNRRGEQEEKGTQHQAKKKREEVKNVEKKGEELDTWGGGGNDVTKT